MSVELLKITDLTVSFPDKDGSLHTVVDHLNLEVRKGQIVGIVGESGSGKSMTSLAVMGLLDEDAIVDPCSSISLNGQELLSLSGDERRKVQGDSMSMIFQEPMTSLNPVIKIKDQVGEILKLHTNLSEAEIDKKVEESLIHVGLHAVPELMEKYPHQLSGGQRQRVMIAMAIINNPDVLIADEPTTALDVTVQAQILKLLKKINEVTGCAILFISHDLNVIKEICQRVIVMYKGKIVEQGRAQTVLKTPQHEYTKRLVASMPVKADTRIGAERILHADKLSVYYPVKKGLFSSGAKHSAYVHEVSFDIYNNEIFGIVGESGCGKSTLVKAIVGINKDITGTLEINDERPQMVFQDPYSSLNPAKKIGWIMQEPLKLKGVKDKAEREKLVNEMLNEIGLDESYAERGISELSGGQRQRISIGLALMRGDRFIIADEPVSALDVTVQSQILRLLLKLHAERDLTYIFISHDLNVVRHMCNRIMVMYLGRIVELADVNELYTNARHPYTRFLFDSVIGEDAKKVPVGVRPAEVVETAGGCSFYPRCRYRCDKCREQMPDLIDIGSEDTSAGPGRPHMLRCFKDITKETPEVNRLSQLPEGKKRN